MVELSTLRELDLDADPEIVVPVEWVERFLHNSPLRGLRTLTGLPRRLLCRLLTDTTPWKLERIEVSPSGGGGDAGAAVERKEADALQAAFENCCGLPRLQYLTLQFNHGIGTRPHDFRWLWSTPAGRRLRGLGLYETAYALRHWQPVLRQRGPELALEYLELLELSELRLERAGGDWSRLTGSMTLQPELAVRELAKALALVRDAVTDVDVDGYCHLDR